MNKSFEEILENINNLTDENYVQTLTDIINIENEDTKIILYNEFIKKIKHMIINYEYENEIKLKEEIESISNNLVQMDFKIGLRLVENGFDFDAIKEERTNLGIKYKDDNTFGLSDNKKEIEKISETIEELQNKYLNLFSNKYLIEELETKIEKINSDLLELKTSSTDKLSEDLLNMTNDLTRITGNSIILTQEQIGELAEKYNISFQEITKKAKKAMKEIEIISKEIVSLTDELEELNTLLNENFEKNYKNISIDELETELNLLKEARENLSPEKEWFNKTNQTIADGANLNEEAELLDNKIEIIEKKLSIEKEIAEKKIVNNDLKKLKIIEKKLSIEKEIAEKKLINNDLKKLNNLKYVKSTYESILKEAIMEYENSNNSKKIDEKVTEFINNHLRVNKLNNYENSTKIKKELHKDIIKVVKPKVVKKIEKRHKLWVKALAGTTGFVLGLGASCVPGIGTIRMTIAGAKLATSIANKGINVWTKNYPNGIVAKLKNNICERIEDVNINLNNKYPKLTSLIKTTREKLKDPVVQWAINGFAAGYLVGNIIELKTGSSISEHIKEKFNLESNNIGNEIITETPNQIEGLPTPEESTPTIPEKAPIIEEAPVIEDVPVIEELPTIEPVIPQSGEIFDLSTLTKGYKSPDAPNMVNIMESLGKEVMFDKAVELPSGKVMWHFKRLNGAGYAWFDSEVVQELLSNSVDTISRVAR